MEEGNSDMDVLLLRKKIEIVHKQLCFEFKENSQNQYLILSNNAFSILVPSNAISCFLDLLDSCIVSQQHEFFNKELKINDKVYNFFIGQNQWGRFLKVSEILASKNCKYIIIPSGNNGNDGWELFKKTLAEMDETSRILFPPLQRIPDPSESHVELADARYDFNTGHSAQNASMSKLHVEPPQNENGSFNVSKTMKTGQKKFLFDLGSNKRGHFLKISEVMGANCFFIIIPLLELKQFYETVSHFLEITNSSSERLSTVMDVKQSSSTYISAQNASMPKLHIEPPQNENSSFDVSETMKAGQKRFFFLLGSNTRGHFLKISEVFGVNCYFITIPLLELKKFYEMVSHFLEITNGSSERLLTGMDVKQSSSTCISDSHELSRVSHSLEMTNSSSERLSTGMDVKQSSSTCISESHESSGVSHSLGMTNSSSERLSTGMDVKQSSSTCISESPELSGVNHSLGMTNSSSERLSTGMDVKQSSSTCISESPELSGVNHSLEMTNSSIERLLTGMDVKQSSSTCISESYESSGVSHSLEMTNSSSERLSTGMDVRQSSSNCISESHELSVVNQHCASGEVK